jgi:hypothetical protein
MISYFEQIFIFTCLLNYDSMYKIGFCFLFQFLIHRFFLLSYTYHVFVASPIIQRLTSCFKILFLISCGTHVCLLGVALSCHRGFMNFVDSKFPSVSKFSINKSFNKFVRKCYGFNFFKLARSLKNSIACVNIAKL